MWLVVSEASLSEEALCDYERLSCEWESWSAMKQTQRSRTSVWLRSIDGHCQPGSYGTGFLRIALAPDLPAVSEKRSVRFGTS